jgi:hypothetical protein
MHALSLVTSTVADVDVFAHGFLVSIFVPAASVALLMLVSGANLTF